MRWYIFSFTFNLSEIQIASIFQIHPMSDHLSPPLLLLLFLSCISSIASLHPQLVLLIILPSFSSAQHSDQHDPLKHKPQEWYSSAQSCSIDFRVKSKILAMTSTALYNIAPSFHSGLTFLLLAHSPPTTMAS